MGTPDSVSLGDLKVGRPAFGSMKLSIEGRPDREAAVATLNAALDHGVTLIDTADAYHIGPDDLGHSERLVAEVLRARDGTDEVVVATKGGKLRPGDGSWPINARPEHLASAARQSADRLGVDQIQLYQLHAPDPEVPFPETLGALAQLVEDGVVAQLGLSNVSLAEVEQAVEFLGPRLVAVQNEFSPARAGDFATLERCGELGLTYLPFRPFGHPSDWDSARWDVFGGVAAKYGVSTHRTILAWELALGDWVIPLPGSTRPATALDSLAAGSLELSPEDLAVLSSAVGVVAGPPDDEAGDR